MVEVCKVQKASEKKVKKHRCFHCNKKIAVAFRNTPCDCGNNYCVEHRLPESHQCIINHQQKHLENRETHITAMKCVAEKVAAI